MIKNIYRKLKPVILLLLLPSMAIASVPADFSSSVNVESSYDLSSPYPILILDKGLPDITPNGRPSGIGFYLTCTSNSNPDDGECPTHPSWWGSGSNVSLSFYEKRTGLKHVATIFGRLSTSCGSKLFTGGPGACNSGVHYNINIPSDELKKFPIGGVWSAHLKLRTGQWHGGEGSIDQTDGFMEVYWTADITLKVTDTHNIKIWFPQFHGSSANVVMPLNKPSVVTAEKTVDACLYDGYNSSSNTFQVTFNSNDVDQKSHDFILRNNSTSGGAVLPYQVFASTPGSSDAIQAVTPGKTLLYSGMNTAAIRQVMMPGLQTPVACVPWSIRLKLKPFDLLKQQAGHYSGVLNLTFTPSLD
ncbi:hypothetical protein O8E94_003562 [Yersinia ruckeri]|nr:hypothetical protein [Yersinia ruckeri]